MLFVLSVLTKCVVCLYDAGAVLFILVVVVVVGVLDLFEECQHAFSETCAKGVLTRICQVTTDQLFWVVSYMDSI